MPGTRRRIDYAELHLHTAYSFLDGASLPEEVVEQADDLGYPALAITDHDGLHGAMEFAHLASRGGIQPITGAELTLVDDSHLTLLVASREGYANLCRLITAAHHHDHDPSRRDPRGPVAPRLDPALLPTHAAGLILLTGCRQGQLAQLVDADCLPAAEVLLRRYVAWFGTANVVVELQHHLVHGDTRRVARLVGLAERLGLPYAATGNVHYHRRERHRLQDVLVAIRHRSTLDATHRERRPNSEFFLRSAAEMAQRFARYPDALKTTVAIAERCAAFDLTRHLDYRFPDYPVPAGKTAVDVLADVCREALAARYLDNRAEAEIRLNEELALIERHRLAGFFLLHRDLLELAREVAAEVRGGTARAAAHLPPGRGRGSSVGSIVCYLIGLSPVDPLFHKLSVGRFLNEDLHSVPDIDLDFPREIRERLLERIHEQYGDRAALVCAFATYKLRSAVRDVGKALGLPPTDLAKIAKLSGSHSAKDLAAELARLPEYAARQDVPPWSYLVELAGELDGFPRHVTQHVGGMIVASAPVTGLVPVQPAAMRGRYLCQWDKDACDDARFVKIDFLALGMLSLIEECLELIAPVGAPPPDLSRIDFEDKAIYEMIQAGDTIGVFQIESRAQIQTLLRTQPKNLNDLVVQVAIVRPGPIVSGAVTPYVLRREQKGYQPTYDHPLLKPVLEETLGVILFQEQVVDVAIRLANFSAGQADVLRRSMSRRRSREVMERLRGKFRAGALANGADRATADRVFDKLLGFSEYGFPKAHAASFAVLAYQSAWLKRYYPTEFTCALFNNQPMGFYPPHVLVNDAKRHGVRVRHPAVNASGTRCTVEDGNAVRVGFNYVAGLGEAAAELIVQERAASVPYRSLADFVRRVPLRPEVVEALIVVGAFDEFGLGRREALWQLGLFVPTRGLGSVRSGQAVGQQLPLPLPVEQDMVALRPAGPWEQMVDAYDTLGLSPHYHPLGLLRRRLPDGIVSTADLARLPDGARVSLAGLVVCRQRPGTAKGITFLLLEDEHGLGNVIVYPDLYDAQRPLVRAEPLLIVDGRLQRRGETINLLAHCLRPLAAACQETSPADPPRRTIDQNAASAAPDPQPALRTLGPDAHNFR